MNENPPRHVTSMYKSVRIVWYILGVVEVLLAFRFFLRLIGANPGAMFTDLIYTLSYPFAAPFLYVVGNTQVSGSVFEWTTLLAMLVWWLVARGIVKLIVMNKPVSPSEADYKLDREDEGQ